jgi:thymidylate kinase
VIVEFTGIPGAGKSTAAELLIESARRRGIEVRSAADVLERARGREGRAVAVVHRSMTVFALLRRPRLTLGLLRGLLASRRSPAERWYALRHVATTVHALELAHRGDDATKLTVFPEGICQRAFLALVDRDGAASHETVAGLLRRAPHPDVVVHLRLPAETALRRVVDRGHGGISYRFDGLSEAQLCRRMQEGDGFLADAVGLLASARPPVKVISLPGDDLAIVSEELERRLFTRMPRPASDRPVPRS